VSCTTLVSTALVSIGRPPAAGRSTHSVKALPAAVPPAPAAALYTTDEEADQPQEDGKDEHVPQHVRRETKASKDRQKKYKHYQSNHVDTPVLDFDAVSATLKGYPGR
jgi:hypothetical protein